MAEVVNREKLFANSKYRAGDLVKFRYKNSSNHSIQKESYSKIIKVKILVDDDGYVEFLYIMENGKTATDNEILALEKRQ